MTKCQKAAWGKDGVFANHQGGDVADTTSDDDHQIHVTPPPSVRRTRSGRIYNREAIDAIDRNSQNVYTRVLSSQ